MERRRTIVWRVKRVRRDLRGRKRLRDPWERFDDLEKALPSIIETITDDDREDIKAFAKGLSISIGAVLGTNDMGFLEYSFAIESLIADQGFSAEVLADSAKQTELLEAIKGKVTEMKEANDEPSSIEAIIGEDGEGGKKGQE